MFDVDAPAPAAVLPVRPEDAEPYADESPVEHDLADDPAAQRARTPRTTPTRTTPTTAYVEEYVDETLRRGRRGRAVRDRGYGEHEVVEEHLVADDDHAATARAAPAPPRRTVVAARGLPGAARRRRLRGLVVPQPALRPASTAGDAPAEDYPGPGTGEVDVVVKPGDTGGAIGSTLVEAGVVASRAAFVAAFTANPEAASIQPGTYQLRRR